MFSQNEMVDIIRVTHGHGYNYKGTYFLNAFYSPLFHPKSYISYISINRLLTQNNHKFNVLYVLYDRGGVSDFVSDFVI